MKKIITSIGLLLFIFPAFSQQEDGKDEVPLPQEDTSMIYITKTKEYIQLNPKDYQKRVELGKFYFTIDSTWAAKKTFEKLIQDIIQDTEGGNNIEDISVDIIDPYLKKNNIEEGNSYIRFCIKITKEYILLNPKDYEKRKWLGMFYLTVDSTWAAKKIFEKLIQDIIQDTDGKNNIEKTYTDIALTYFRKNYLIEAEFYYNLALEKVRVKDKIDNIIYIYEILSTIYTSQFLYQEQLSAVKNWEVYLKRKYENDTLDGEYNLYKYKSYRNFYIALSDAYTKSKDYQNTLISIDKSLPYIENDTSQEFIEYDQQYYYALYYHNRGHALLELDELDSAYKYLGLAQ